MAKKENNDYCLECDFRAKGAKTNLKKHCEVGYKQNPGSKKATKNLLANGGKICSLNPWNAADPYFRAQGLENVLRGG